MGYSDPPGYFFWITLVSIGICGASFYYGRGTTIGFVIVVLFGAIAFLAVWGIPTGMSDVRIYDGPNCPQCGQRVKRIWPWSL